MMPNQRYLDLILILLATFANGCSSLSKDAKSLMEKGDYSDAVTTWNKVLAEDPNDEEAMRLRKVSQNELLNVDLVTLKSLLDSHQTISAFDHLTKINENRKQWNLGVDPNSGFYLKQQIERLYGQYLELIGNEITAKHPLKARYLEKHYRALLQTEKAPEEITLQTQLTHEGIRQCDELELNSRTEDYLRLYSVVFCKTFGKSVSLTKANETRLRGYLLQFPNITSSIQGLTDADQKVIIHTLSTALSHAPAFSTQGTQDSKLNFNGTFAQNQSSRQIPMNHSYSIQIPYTEYRTVNNPVSQPYSSSENRCDPTGQHCWNESVTHYQSVDHFETLTETKYRAEPHIYNFMATELRQSIQLDFQANLKSTLQTLSIPYQGRFAQTEVSHRENLPDIGLSPQIRTLESKEVWLTEELPKIASALDQNLQDDWITKHCKAAAKQTRWQIANHVFECMRSTRGSSEALVQNWYQTEVGLSTSQSEEITGPISYL